MKAKSHAKINWSLAILRKRADDYHDIDTLMQKIELHDHINMNICNDNTCIVLCGKYMQGVPNDRKNLAYKAAKMYLACSNIQEHWEICIDKEIPNGAGLGGGSSNAATVLRLLETHYGALGEKKLMDIAMKIGADVTFFLYNSAARCRGIGEKIEAIHAKSLSMLIVKSEDNVSTSKAYQLYSKLRGDTKETTRQKIRQLDICQRAIEDGNLLKLASASFNDLLKPAESMSPSIKLQIQMLSDLGGTVIGMSGSGSACFAVFDNDQQLQQAYRQCGEKFVVLTKTLESNLT